MWCVISLVVLGFDLVTRLTSSSSPTPNPTTHHRLIVCVNMPDSEFEDDLGDEVEPPLDNDCCSLDLHADRSDEQNFIIDIDSIQAHGIGVADINKLKSNGFYTVAVRNEPTIIFKGTH